MDGAYHAAVSAGLPVVREEVALQGYHYYPEDVKVREWLKEAGFHVVREEKADGYWHLLMMKSLMDWHVQADRSCAMLTE